jgi:hypothetical protein
VIVLRLRERERERERERRKRKGENKDPHTKRFPYFQDKKVNKSRIFYVLPPVSSPHCGLCVMIFRGYVL